MKVLKGIWNIILSFLLCLILLGGFVVILFSHTLLNKEYILKQMEKQDYYGRVQTDLKNGFEEYQYQSGFPDEVFEDLYTNELLREDIDSMINHLYDTNIEIMEHSSIVEEQLTKKINQYLEQNNIVLTETEQQNIDEYKKLIVNVYENKINVLRSYIDKVADIVVKIEQIVRIAEKVVIGALIIMIVVILATNCRTIGDGICTIATSLLATGVLLELIRFVVTKNIDIKNILLLSQSLSDFVKEIMYHILSKFTIFGIVFIVVGIVSIVVAKYLHCNKDEFIEE